MMNDAPSVRTIFEQALELAFDADPWGSTIFFASGIAVTLGGTLELAFAPGVNGTTQLGRTFDLFDWTSVTPTGGFDVASPFDWDFSQLYTAGEVTLTGQRQLGQGALRVAPSTAVPEPASFVMLVIGAVTFSTRRCSRCKYNRDAYGVSSTQLGGTL